MSTNSPKADNQEIDLSSVGKGIGNVFRSLNTFIFNCIQFVIRNIVLFVILVVIGGGLGAYLDYSSKKIYGHQIIVSPNFGSTDYLYSKVALIESRLKENDTVFLKAIGIQDPKDLLEIRIMPIIDIFKFVANSGNDQNYRLIELMAQDGDIKKVAVDNTTSKNYPYHSITFATRGKTSKEKTVTPLLNYLNDNAYFKKVQQEYLKNVDVKLKANDVIINQIDQMLNNYATKNSGSAQVNINENSQLNDVIKTKDELIREQGVQRIELVGLDKVIKDNSTIINIKDEDSLTGKMKVVLPALLIILFMIIYFFRAFYRKQAAKYSTK